MALGNNTVLHEPPPIEGYLYRYKTTTHLRDPVYLTTHNGNIFFLNPNSAHPPLPPTAALHETPEPESLAPVGISTNSDSGTRNTPKAQATGSSVTRASEILRGASQILNAKLFLDMRNIVSVKRLTEPVGPSKPATGLKPGKGKASSVTSRERRHSTTTHGSSTDSETRENAGPNIDHSDSRAGHTPPVDEDEEDHLEEADEIKLGEDDLADIGGDEVLDKLTGEAKTNLKTKRSFEIVTRSHERIQFEVRWHLRIFHDIAKLYPGI